VTNAAPAITSTDQAGNVPALAQGNINTGTFYLTQMRYYDGAPAHTNGQVQSTLQITVVGQLATIQGIENGQTFTLTIVMATPSTNPPTAVNVVCTTSAALFGPVGSITANFDYDGGNTLDLYIPSLRLRRRYAHQ
jgi:hypothetical protein